MQSQDDHVKHVSMLRKLSVCIKDKIVYHVNACIAVCSTSGVVLFF